MKAAVIFQKGGMPEYSDMAEPVIQNDDELLITLKAAAIKHVDRSRASGTHYSSDKDMSHAKVIGGDGVGLLADGTRVYAMGVSGMAAEKATIEKDKMVPVPENLDSVTAAALPNAVIGSAMALRYKAKIKQGDVVLINGATGFTGKVALQMAKHYGAAKVIVTGRNPDSLKELMALGVDYTIATELGDEQFVNALKEQHALTPVDIVIDYLWGHTAELILGAFKGNGSFTHRVRFVSIGSMTGDKIELSAANLRSCDLQLSGSGLGAWSREEVSSFFSDILPEAFRLAADGKLKVETFPMPLSDIEKIYQMDIPNGKRLVVTMG